MSRSLPPPASPSASSASPRAESYSRRADRRRALALRPSRSGDRARCGGAARDVEGRPGFAGAARALGGVAGISGPPTARDVEGRHGFAGAARALGGWRAYRGPPPRGMSRGATASPGRPEHWGGCGGPYRGPPPRGMSRGATASPGRPEHWGGGGHIGAPHRAGCRGAPRLRRGGPSIGGVAGISGPPTARDVEGRHGFAGAARALGGVWGAISGPPTARDVEGRHGFAGAARALGG